MNSLISAFGLVKNQKILVHLLPVWKNRFPASFFSQTDLIFLQ